MNRINKSTTDFLISIKKVAEALGICSRMPYLLLFLIRLTSSLSLKVLLLAQPRLASTQGKNAMLAGVKQGAKTGAITEGAISGAQEGIINTAGQMRDVSLGLRDEVSQTEILGATAFGTIAGAGVGSILGAGGGAFGARGADQAVADLRALGVDDASIANMSNDQVKAALADPDATRAQYSRTRSHYRRSRGRANSRARV